MIIGPSPAILTYFPLSFIWTENVITFSCLWIGTAEYFILDLLQIAVTIIFWIRVNYFAKMRSIFWLRAWYTRINSFIYLFETHFTFGLVSLLWIDILVQFVIRWERFKILFSDFQTSLKLWINRVRILSIVCRTASIFLINWSKIASVALDTVYFLGWI